VRMGWRGGGCGRNWLKIVSSVAGFGVRGVEPSHSAAEGII
jgi:hypothetical protein